MEEYKNDSWEQMGEPTQTLTETPLANIPETPEIDPQQMVMVVHENLEPVAVVTPTQQIQGMEQETGDFVAGSIMGGALGLFIQHAVKPRP